MTKEMSESEVAAHGSAALEGAKAIDTADTRTMAQQQKMQQRLHRPDTGGLYDSTASALAKANSIKDAPPAPEDAKRLEDAIDHLGRKLDDLSDETSILLLKYPLALAFATTLKALDAMKEAGAIKLPGNTAAACQHMRDAMLEIFTVRDDLQKDATAHDVLTDILNQFVTFPAYGRRFGKPAP